MEENRNDLIPEEIENKEHENDVPKTEEIKDEATKKEYTDPNKDVFLSGPNTGNAGDYSYGQNHEGQGASCGYGYQNDQYGQYNQYRQYSQPQQPQMDTTPLSMGEWLLTLLIAMVPCVGFVVYCVWAFGNSGNLNRRNFCRAYLIMEAISIVFVLIFIIFTAVFTTARIMY